MHTAILLLARRPDDVSMVWDSPPQPIDPDATTATLLFDQITVTAELGGRTTDPELMSTASGRPGAVVMRALTHTATVTVTADTASALDQALSSIGEVGAGLIWWPESGDMKLIGAHRGTPGPAREPRSALTDYDPGLANVAIYLLLAQEPTSLGQVLSDYMPNRAAELTDSAAMSTLVRYPDDGSRIRLQVIKSIPSDELATHAGGEVPEHRAAVQIMASGKASTLDLVMYQASFAAELARRPEAAGVWIPWQERFEPAGVILGEDPKKLPHVALHSGHGEDMDLLYTRGMRRYRGRDIIIEDLGPDYPIGDLVLLICADAIASGNFPQPGGRMPSGLDGIDALFHDITDPWSGEAALNMELVKPESGA